AEQRDVGRQLVGNEGGSVRRLAQRRAPVGGQRTELIIRQGGQPAPRLADMLAAKQLAQSRVDERQFAAGAHLGVGAENGFQKRGDVECGSANEKGSSSVGRGGWSAGQEVFSQVSYNVACVGLARRARIAVIRPAWTVSELVIGEGAIVIARAFTG